MRVTVIPEDRTIVVDGKSILNIPDWPFEDSHIHAIQWYDDKGEYEIQNGQNVAFSDWSMVEPYVTLHATLSEQIQQEREAEAARIQEEEARLLAQPNYSTFWNLIITSDLYTVFREEAKQNLALNTILTEFIALIADAKLGNAIEVAIQNCITEIVTICNLSEQQKDIIRAALAASNMIDVYTI